MEPTLSDQVQPFVGQLYQNFSLPTIKGLPRCPSLLAVALKLDVRFYYPYDSYALDLRPPKITCVSPRNRLRDVSNPRQQFPRQVQIRGEVP